MLPMLLIFAQDAMTLEAAMAAYREKTRADVPCRVTDQDDEIVVCALRNADRFRVPFVQRGAGAEDARLREARLTTPPATPCGQGAFLVHCGKVGVTVSVDSRGAHWVERPLAP
ncbi:hypothetical protein TS85_17805 [Sphingomonas hengshuiensis]|uniref:Uncharacterized protein n=2 Tax=Sphingomonas hengshuiensis TaxID=1609977 RepID=A0A7U5CV92_9SPHN|nr:hypothetical protein TS85_17805 [Sphingomonas hengshuiensis]